jgi:glyoxylase-like metal-dependent hydrolase (beta-lactamase superfamily II)
MVMSTSEDHEGLANELERETDALQRESDKLDQEIADTRADWEAKRNDPSVPGAPPPPPKEGGDEDEVGGPTEPSRTDED